MPRLVATRGKHGLRDQQRKPCEHDHAVKMHPDGRSDRIDEPA
jgi:hypothetical protein